MEARAEGMRELYLGIDVGTTGLRANFYYSDGTKAGGAEAVYPVSRPFPGGAEQSPYDWMSAMETAVRKGMSEYRIAPEEVVSMAVASTCCSVVLCDREGKPLRDCILWMDVRAADEQDEILALTGEHLSAEWMPAKLLWLSRHERERYDRSEVFCECQDWLTHELTGIWSVNINTACNWGYDADRGGFPEWFYHRIGIPEALTRFPSDHVFRVGDPIGCLTEKAASRLGLSEKTLVAQGGVDASIGILGMGVTGPGTVALMTGTSNLAMLLTEQQLFRESTINAGPHHLYPGFFTSVRGQLTSNAILKWFRDEVCLANDEDLFYDEMEKQAARIAPGSEGLLVLDYWQGNRQPYYDPKVRGMIYGLSLRHTRAHIYRALMEGISYGTYNLMLQFSKAGGEVREIHISGGTTYSRLFTQIQADVSGFTIRIPEDRQSVSKGAAICAAKAAGRYPTLQDCVRSMVRFAQVVEPDKERNRIYQEIFHQYECLYPQMKDWMHETTRVAGGLELD